MLGLQVYVLFFPKNVRMSNYKIIYVPTGISNIVRNPSGAIRDISRLFEDADIHLRSSSFCTAGSTHARRIPPYNHKLHLFLLCAYEVGPRIFLLGYSFRDTHGVYEQIQ
jgi:hypothetical protein